MRKWLHSDGKWLYSKHSSVLDFQNFEFIFFFWRDLKKNSLRNEQNGAKWSRFERKWALRKVVLSVNGGKTAHIIAHTSYF